MYYLFIENGNMKNALAVDTIRQLWIILALLKTLTSHCDNALLTARQWHILFTVNANFVTVFIHFQGYKHEKWWKDAIVCQRELWHYELGNSDLNHIRQVGHDRNRFERTNILECITIQAVWFVLLFYCASILTPWPYDVVQTSEFCITLALVSSSQWCKLLRDQCNVALLRLGIVKSA